MARVLLLVEGQTEERFVKEVLTNHLASHGTFFHSTLIRTRRVIGGPDFRGGVTSYSKIRRDLIKLFNDTDAKYISSMIDYYALPNDFPGLDELDNTKSPIEKVEFLESKFYEDINQQRFIPYLQLHEFESILFSSRSAIKEVLNDEEKIKAVDKILTDFSNCPEDINNSNTTAPSKRLKQIYPEYQKPLHGSLISSKIDFETIKAKCPHFKSWIDKLTS